jgi:hypothetical protein
MTNVRARHARFALTPPANVTRAEHIALLAQVTALQTRVDALERGKTGAGSRFSPPSAQNEQLLIAIAAAVADRAFSAAEVMAHAVYDEPLQRALAAAGISNARRLGKLFRRFEGSDIAGLQLQRIGSDYQGIIWRVARTEQRGDQWLMTSSQSPPR